MTRASDRRTAALVDRLVREILASPGDRMTAFAAAMIVLREALAAANPKASRRALATKGHELGLQVLDRVTAETHRRQVVASAKQDSR